MAYDVGDTYLADFTVRDSLGVATTPGTIVVTVTSYDDDGTPHVDTPTVPAPISTGHYQVPYVIAREGRHTWRAVATVPNWSYTDAFNAWPTASIAIVGLIETKEYLNLDLTKTTYDEELRRTIAGASRVVEGIVGVVAVRQFTRTFSGRRSRALLLPHRPVVSVASVSENGMALALTTDYVVSRNGVLYRQPTGALWSDMAPMNVAVSWWAGRPKVGENITDGTKELIRVNWKPQFGGIRSPFELGAPQPQQGGEVRLGFFVPNAVMERLKPDARGPETA